MLGFLILLFFQWGSEVLCRALSLRFPGSVLGMLLLTAALRLRLVREEWIRESAEFLIRYLPIFFIPAGVLCLRYKQMVFAHSAAIGVSAAVSTVLVLVVVAKIYEWMERP